MPPKGYAMSEDAKNRISKAMSGENHPSFGKKRSEECKQKMRDAARRRREAKALIPKEPKIKVKKVLSEEHKLKIGNAIRGEKNGFYGKTHSKEVKAHLSELTIGRKASEETRKKLSDAHRGKKHQMPEKWYASQAAKAERQRGQSQSLESNLKRSLTLKGIVFTEEHKEKLSGLNHPGYKGAKPRKYPKEFSQQLKELIRDRENHICKICGRMESDTATSLMVHHIDNNVNHNSPDNLVAICMSCHSKIHVTYAKDISPIIKSYQDRLLS